MAEDTSSPPKVWLMKSEPDEYSLDDLVRDNVGVWDGIRNYQARNFLRSMTPGDKAYFYYSNCKEPGIYGVMRIHGSAVGDVKALDKKSKYYDPRAKSPETNPWSSVTVTLERRFAVPLLLPQIKALPALSNCRLVAKGNRLSVFPIDRDEAAVIDGELSRLNEGVRETTVEAEALQLTASTTVGTTTARKKRTATEANESDPSPLIPTKTDTKTTKTKTEKETIQSEGKSASRASKRNKTT